MRRFRTVKIETDEHRVEVFDRATQEWEYAGRMWKNFGDVWNFRSTREWTGEPIKVRGTNFVEVRREARRILVRAARDHGDCPRCGAPDVDLENETCRGGCPGIDAEICSICGQENGVGESCSECEQR